MLVCHVVDRLDGIGGVQTYLTDLLPALAARGIDGVVVTERPFAGRLNGVRVHAVPGVQRDGAFLPEDVRSALRKTLAAERPDACIVHVAPSPDVVATCAAVAPTLAFAHDYFMACPGNARYLARARRFCHEGPGARCFVRAYTERTASRSPRRLVAAYARQRAWRDGWRRTARVLVASPFVRDVLVEHGVAHDHISVLPYFVEAEQVPLAAERDVDVLFVGRLVPMKGADVLVDALALLPGRRAVIAGSGPEEGRLREQVARLGLADRVELCGAVDASQRRGLLARARVLALPSLWAEPFGIAGVEALAAGLPVVASSVGGIPSWLPSSHMGLAVPPGDAAALARSLDDALSRDDYDELAAEAVQAAERFTLDQHVEGLCSELRAIRAV